jgi:hypothetical protein
MNVCCQGKKRSRYRIFDSVSSTNGRPPEESNRALQGAASLRLRGGPTMILGDRISAAPTLVSTARPPTRMPYFSGRAQKPSSARPTQPNANRQQTTAATDAVAAIILADNMTEPFLGPQQTLSNDLCSKMAGIRQDEKTRRLWRCCNITQCLPAKTRNRCP